MPEAKNSKKDKSKKVYEKPKLKKLGNISKVTQKTGTPPDQQQMTKPGGGQG